MPRAFAGVCRRGPQSRFRALVLGLVIALALPTSADASSHASSTSFHRFEHRLRKFDSATVSHVDHRLVAPGEFHVLSSERVEREWLARALEIILVPSRVDLSGTRAVSHESDHYGDEPDILIEFGVGARATELVMHFGSNSADVRPGVHQSRGSIDLGARAGELFDLVKLALPRDSVLQQMRLSKVDPKAVWSPVVGDSLRRAGLPTIGEYVYADVMPVAIRRVPPAYPETGMKHVSGTVILKALVDRRGDVVQTYLVRSSPFLDEVAEAALRQWTFKPATRDGKPVAIWVDVPFKFSLH
jgi:TonB family protein